MTVKSSGVSIDLITSKDWLGATGFYHRLSFRMLPLRSAEVKESPLVKLSPLSLDEMSRTRGIAGNFPAFRKGQGTITPFSVRLRPGCRRWLLSNLESGKGFLRVCLRIQGCPGISLKRGKRLRGFASLLAFLQITPGIYRKNWSKCGNTWNFHSFFTEWSPFLIWG